jgi:hypothetical protein
MLLVDASTCTVCPMHHLCWEYPIQLGACYFENLPKSTRSDTEFVPQSLSQAVTSLTWIPEVPGANLVWDTGSPE